ncbi:hypothetical protein PsYK624_070360 [Phanerochaete sordida]|uniref:Uncharacterized protein n=1 Tax=Phanerochaete sordida TaxID=48140 RepID=A0A9P3GAB3_9APHY|nr:hypothetical protein PsYK624_070360 [Phanerochaete sordida]
MAWTTTDHDSLRVSCLYGVALRGYPFDRVPFDSPSRFGRRRDLELLVQGWESGAIFFERMTLAEVCALAKREHTLVEQLPLVPLRIDVGRRRIRGPDTRSAFLGANKTDVLSNRRTDCVEDRPLAKRLRV